MIVSSKNMECSCHTQHECRLNDSATISLFHLLNMDLPPPRFHLPLWLQTIVASTGGLGLFLIAFLDSSVLSFPVINDLLLLDLSVHNPARMPFYAAMATLGSVAGCLLL